MPIGQQTTNYVKYGIRTLWNGFLIYYLCGDTASTYLKTYDTKKWKSVSIVFGICVLVFMIGSFSQY